MKSARFKTLAAAGVLVLIASLGLSLAEQSLFHTDDGCDVEIHCVACRLVLGSVVVAASPLTFETRLARAGDVATVAVRAVPAPCPRVAVSRGPPSSLFSAS
jgi:hypothetical protein